MKPTLTLEPSNLSDCSARTGFANADRADDRAAAVGVVGAGSVFVGVVDVDGLSDEVLGHRLKILGGAESGLAAMKAEVLAVLNKRHSKTETQELLRNELGQSGREAKRDTETAARLAELPATREALASGKIPKAHAELIARASGESDVDEGLLADTAKSQGFDEFARSVKRHQQQVSTDDGESLIDRQRKNRKANIFESADSGMFVLTGEFDQITGARIATALTDMEHKLWGSENPKDRVSPQQRRADALTALICDTTSDEKTKSQGTDLLIIADYNVLSEQLENPRLADGSPTPLVELHRLALKANLLPAIFDVKTQNMWLGRKQRCASQAQRVALIARDKRCVGCGANPLWCRAHHIIYWSNDGPTNIDNLVLVCDNCHHKIHDDGWSVSQHPTTNKYVLKPPTIPPDPNSRRPANTDRPNHTTSKPPNPTARGKPQQQEPQTPTLFTENP